MNKLTREQQVAALEKEWAQNPRWKGIKRSYSAMDVVRLEIALAVFDRFTMFGHDRFDLDCDLDARRQGPLNSLARRWRRSTQSGWPENQIDVPVGRTCAQMKVQIVYQFACGCLLTDLRTVLNKISDDCLGQRIGVLIRAGVISFFAKMLDE